jgi:hypothetical protein
MGSSCHLLNQPSHLHNAPTESRFKRSISVNGNSDDEANTNFSVDMVTAPDTAQHPVVLFEKTTNLFTRV